MGAQCAKRLLDLTGGDPGDVATHDDDRSGSGLPEDAGQPVAEIATALRNSVETPWPGAAVEPSPIRTDGKNRPPPGIATYPANQAVELPAIPPGSTDHADVTAESGLDGTGARCLRHDVQLASRPARAGAHASASERIRV